MMKKVVLMAVIVMMLLTNKTQAGVSIVFNGSFEDDGEILDITLKAPHGWSDVNVPEPRFRGWVNKDWSSHGYNDGDCNSLTLCTDTWYQFADGDMATVSQRVYLEDVNQIIFDLQLATIGGWPWNPEKRTALVYIDGEDVWDSNILGPDADGEYFDQIAEIPEKYKDANLHTLSLAIRSNVTEVEYIYAYSTRWDFVKFDMHCGGFGYLPEDLNRDCYVDMNDLAILAEQWLAEYPDEKYDLFQDDENIVNLFDFAIFANRWMDTTDWRNDNAIEFRLLAADLNNDGIVDFRDFAILAKDWDCRNYDDISELVDEWLQKSWLYGLE